MNLEWDNYIQSLSKEYGKLTNIIWISKKRGKFILEFAYARVLIINDEKYHFKDILSCKMEKAPYMCNDAESNSEPQIILIGTNNKTDMLLSITVWSKSVAIAINDLMQEIIKSNKICHYE